MKESESQHGFISTMSMVGGLFELGVLVHSFPLRVEDCMTSTDQDGDYYQDVSQ